MIRKKILITAGALGMGGLENQLVYLAKHADSTEFQIDYTSTDQNAYYKEDILNAGCGFYVLPDPRKDGTITYCFALYRLIKKNKYDVVHSQELFHSGIEMFVAWLAGAPKRISHSHSTKDGSSHNGMIKRIYHFVMRRSIHLFATDYLACSKIAGQFLYGKNIANNPKFRVVVNSVETDQFFKGVEKNIIPKKVNWKYITHVGRFVDVKNHNFMIDIAGELKRTKKRIVLVFVGDGELYNNCVQRVKKEKLEEYVIFMGQRKDVSDILLESDAFILPSLYEGMPLSVIEAQAAGLPCVIADHVAEEVDFDIGLIKRCNLNDPIFEWIESIENAVRVVHPQKERILSAIKEKGFGVSDFQHKLCEIYME